MASVRVLIVDDSQTFRAFVNQCLIEMQEPPIEVLAAVEDGAKALQWIRNYDMDLVILDLQMPEIDGFKVIEFARQVKPKLPLIVVSGIAASDEGVRALQLGAHYVIPKAQLSATALKKALKTILGRRGVTAAVAE